MENTNAAANRDQLPAHVVTDGRLAVLADGRLSIFAPTQLSATKIAEAFEALGNNVRQYGLRLVIHANGS